LTWLGIVCAAALENRIDAARIDADRCSLALVR